MTELINAAVIQSPPFMISKITLEPGDTVAAPLGDVLHVGFAGSTAFAWVKHHPAEKAVMNLATLPTGGPFTLETATGFQQATHVGSFVKTGNIKLGHGVDHPGTSCWHVFCWLPVNLVLN